MQMAAPEEHGKTDPQAIVAVLRAELDAALADKAALADALAARSTELATRNTEYDERIEYQSATSAVLKAMSGSPGDPQPVFDLIVRRARDLCDAYGVTVYEFDGKLVHYRAATGVSDDPEVRKAIAAKYPMPLSRDMFPHRAILDRKLIRIDDLQSEPGLSPIYQTIPVKSAVSIPLVRGDATIGALAMGSRDRGGFTDSQIELLKTFAEQAVIAIENARLFNEVQTKTRDLTESLQQQTATAEVLKVISRSAFDLQAIFNTVARSALELCAADGCALFLREGDLLCARGVWGMDDEFAKLMRDNPVKINVDSHMGRVVLTGGVANIADFQKSNTRLRKFYNFRPFNSFLAVALRREDQSVGVFTIYRDQAGGFTERQVELVKTFADQAAIAVENARLFDEVQARTRDLSESLQQQTATADVLKVISRSSVDLEAVLDTLLETVARLCRADQAVMFRRRGDLYHLVTARGLPEEAREFILAHPLPADRSTLSGRVALERRVVHIPDILQDPEYTYLDVQKIQHHRTMLGIPLLREEVLLGIFNITRTRVEPFAQKEIELANTFADQAVIAIENARLFEELHERQAELRVTFDNMGDGVVMFDSEHRLTAWNRNFQEILDLPEAFLAERPSYVEYFRYLAERGEYSTDLEVELGRRLHETDRESRIERKRPDGRVIEVRRNPVAGGGFVLIYADITERKRAEEQIRAARDAAETALRELQMAQASLVHAQKMAALGQVTAGIAHEIKNPLNFVNNFAGLSVELLDELKEAARTVGAVDPGKRAEIVETIGMLTGNLEKIVEHGRRADGIVRSMLQHSRGGSDDWQATDLNALVEEALNLAYHGARAQDTNFNVSLERDLDLNLASVDVVPQELTRVLLNLISNAFYAAIKRSREGDATYRPALKVTTRDFGESVEVRVRDNGTGIPLENREKLFQPFFTTKPTGEGTGLGLSISYEIVTQQHGGTITVDSEVGDFTEFTVRLPRRRHAVAARMG
jgi:PAS domain S-box-containing protein